MFNGDINSRVIELYQATLTPEDKELVITCHDLSICGEKQGQVVYCGKSDPNILHCYKECHQINKKGEFQGVPIHTGDLDIYRISKSKICMCGKSPDISRIKDLIKSWEEYTVTERRYHLEKFLIGFAADESTA